MKSDAETSGAPRPRRRRLRSWIKVGAAAAVLLVGIAVAVAVPLYRHLATVVDEKFAGRRWDFPSRIYSDEFLLYVGLDVAAARVPRRLERLSYRTSVGEPVAGGEYREAPGVLEIALRAGALGRRQTQRVRLDLDQGRISAINDLDGGEPLAAVALEPEELTGIYDGRWEDRRAIKVTDATPILIRALLVSEDRRFFSHHGIDVIGIGRALVTNLRSGRVREGGSTLTQQLMKNFFLTSERRVSRKLTEIGMALVAEQRYSKMQILENYLNEIYLGQRGARGIYGVAEASDFYFAKQPRDLSVGEAALLVGLIRSPNRYSPFIAPERALQRRNTVLRLLLDAGDIDQTTYAAAVAAPLGVVDAPPDATIAPFFVDYVKSELIKRFPEDMLTSEGLNVYTTLDPLMQEDAQRALQANLTHLEKERPKLAATAGKDRLEAALVAIAPGSGKIRAMVGGRSYQASQFNRAVQARRQTGSTFKPIVYLAAMLDGDPSRHLTPASRLDDAPFSWPLADGRAWTPSNYGDHYLGEVTARVALERSLNAAAAHVAQTVGLAPIIDLAHAMGINGPLPEVPALALGAGAATPLEMASVYAVLANGGTRAEPVAIVRVTSRDGEPILGEPPALRAVVPPDTAYVLTHMLEGVLDAGTASSARSAGFRRPAAGKTGTTNDYRDAWFVGYTPDLVAAVWVGFDQRSALGMSGGAAALPLWTAFMKDATASLPPRPFLPPPGVTMVRLDRASGEVLASDASREAGIVEAFLDADAPAAAALEHDGAPAPELEPIPSPGETRPLREERLASGDDGRAPRMAGE
ncbi:PBP1A family penicillin-binding protein [Candidatus Binatia bacterium]|nr:PBP1A family penicillin-binding protein [Candidatus Binatia bacterium]